MLIGHLGFAGKAGASAYEIAVKNGFVGTEQDWLASLGKTSMFEIKTQNITLNTGNNVINLSDDYNSITDSILLFIEGRLFNNYELNGNSISLANAIDVDNTNITIVYISSKTNHLPIVETISSESTNETTPSTKAVFDYINSKLQELKEELGDE